MGADYAFISLSFFLCKIFSTSFFFFIFVCLSHFLLHFDLTPFFSFSVLFLLFNWLFLSKIFLSSFYFSKKN